MAGAASIVIGFCVGPGVGVGVGVTLGAAAAADFNASVFAVKADTVGAETETTAGATLCADIFDNGAAGNAATTTGGFATGAVGIVFEAGSADVEVPAGPNAITGVEADNRADAGREAEVCGAP